MKTSIPLRVWLILVLVSVGIVSLTLWNTKFRNNQPEPLATVMQPAEATLSQGPSNRTIAAADLPPVISVEERREQRILQQQQSKEIVETGRSKLSTQYQNERIDGGWAVAKEQTLTALGTSTQMEGLNAAPRNLKVQCRATTCRLTADFATKLAADDWFTLYSLDAGAEMPNVSLHQTFNADGTVRVELYGFARK